MWMLASRSCAAAMVVSMGFKCVVPFRRCASAAAFSALVAAAAAGLTFLGVRRLFAWAALRKNTAMMRWGSERRRWGHAR